MGRAEKQRRVFDKAFKMNAVRLVIDEGMTQEEVSLKLDIGRTAISRWVKAYRQEPEAAFPGKGRQAAGDSERAKLRKELKTAQDERDILKKALAIFSRPKSDDSGL